MTDPLLFKSTNEYAALTGAPETGSTFWGKDFLLIDIDASGPVSINIPPGTYNGTQLAAAVEIATKNAFGDDKKILLENNVDNKFSIDLKVTSGDGLSTGLPTPIEVDLHLDSIVTDEPELGMTRETFLSHAQVRMNDSMNEYIQAAGTATGVIPGAGAGVNADKVADLNVDGKLFKKLVGSEISKTDIPKTGVPAAAAGTLRMTGNDIVTVTQKTGAGTVGAGTDIFTRYVAYSNDSDGALADTPQVKAYDHNVEANMTAGMGVHPVGHALAGKPYFNVPIAGFTLTPETVRFMQFPTTVEVAVEH